MVSFSALASAVLASRAAIQLSRSAVLEAWKVCLCPLTLNRNSLLPSLVTSVTSACRQLAPYHITLCAQPRTNQVEDTSRSSLVLGALGVEEQALAGLASPGGDGVGDGRLLVLVEDGQVLALHSLLGEVEETLGEAQTPRSMSR